tara:strand:+ start:919 stop:1617 length:699 start_codon:yes stop_codon:yes gene_type:complete
MDRGVTAPTQSNTFREVSAMTTIYSIYQITNNVNHKSYIGFSGDVSRRFNDHKRLSKTNPKQSIHKAIKQFGVENFLFEVIYQSWDKIHTLQVMEPHFIQTLQTQAHGYNETKGGGTCTAPTKHTRTLRSESMKQYWADPAKRLTQSQKRKQYLSNPKVRTAIASKSSQYYSNPKNRQAQSKRLSKSWIITYPDGKEEITDTLRKWCDDHGLNYNSIWRNYQVSGFAFSKIS